MYKTKVRLFDRIKFFNTPQKKQKTKKSNNIIIRLFRTNHPHNQLQTRAQYKSKERLYYLPHNKLQTRVQYKPKVRLYYHSFKKI